MLGLLLGCASGSAAGEPDAARGDAGADAGLGLESAAPTGAGAEPALERLPLALPVPWRKRRIWVDAGHGAPGNEGAVSVTCMREQDHTLWVAQGLARRLAATGAFEVRQSREPLRSSSYPSRVEQAERWPADAIVSLHMDARGEGVVVGQRPDGRPCIDASGHTGFSVLWSDEAAAAEKRLRRVLGGALARRLAQAGFAPYDGEDYPGLYDPTPDEPGLFVDRHLPGRRIWFLRKPRVPVVIIETHQSLDRREHALWQRERTLDAFADAVAAGLVDALR